MVWSNSQPSRSAKTSLAEIMSEQLVFDVEDGGSRSEVEETDRARFATSDTCDDNDDADLALALKLSLEEPRDEPSNGDLREVLETSAPQPDTSADYALALQLNEDEEAALQHFRQSEANNIRGKVRIAPRFAPKSLSPSTDEYDDVDFTTEDMNECAGTEKSIVANLDYPKNVSKIATAASPGEIITKHDTKIAAKRNGMRIFDSNIHGGGKVEDKNSSQIRLSGSVYNSLLHTLKKQDGVVKGTSVKMERDTRQTHAKGLDDRTRLIIHRLVNSGLLEKVFGAIRTGKEAVAYHAIGSFNSETREENLHSDFQEDDTWLTNSKLPKISLKNFAVKVFKTTLTGFKTRSEYIKGDYRFREIESLSYQNPQKVIKAWTEKEFRNLIRATRAGIPCPYPVKLASNVLVMEFIGDESTGIASPQLREVSELSSRRLERCYIEVLFIIHALVVRCGLVHCDLSEHNLLYMRDRRNRYPDRSGGDVVVIDMGQSVVLAHPLASEFLLKDCFQVTTFFKNKGVKRLVDATILRDLLLEDYDLSRRSSAALISTQSNTSVPANTVDDDCPEVLLARSLGDYACPTYAKRLHLLRANESKDV